MGFNTISPTPTPGCARPLALSWDRSYRAEATNEGRCCRTIRGPTAPRGDRKPLPGGGIPGSRPPAPTPTCRWKVWGPGLPTFEFFSPPAVGTRRLCTGRRRFGRSRTGPGRRVAPAIDWRCIITVHAPGRCSGTGRCGWSRWTRCLYPDPTARRVDGCEYYLRLSLHRRAFARLFRDAWARRGLTPWARPDEGIPDPGLRGGGGHRGGGEFWYRDGEGTWPVRPRPKGRS
jgi:hypothetical protein